MKLLILSICVTVLKFIAQNERYQKNKKSIAPSNGGPRHLCPSIIHHLNLHILMRCIDDPCIYLQVAVFRVECYNNDII